jgi:hypothetical protein
MADEVAATAEVSSALKSTLLNVVESTLEAAPRLIAIEHNQDEEFLTSKDKNDGRVVC